MSSLSLSKKLILTGIGIFVVAWILAAIELIGPAVKTGEENLGPGFDFFLKFIVLNFVATILLFIGGMIFFRREFSWQRRSDLFWALPPAVICVGNVGLICWLVTFSLA